MIAELVFAVIPLAASVGHLLLNGIDNYRKQKTLLRNGSDLEDLIKALKYLVDKFEGVTITDDVSKEYMDLYIRMKDKVIKLYHKINQMKDDYQKHPRHSSIRALFDDTSLTKDFRSALRAVEDFQIVQNFICHGIYPKPPTIDAEQLTCSMRSAIREKFHAHMPAQPRTSSRVDKRIKYAQDTHSRRNQRPGSFDRVRRNMDKCIYNRQKRGTCRNCGGHNHRERESAAVVVGAAWEIILSRLVGRSLPAIVVGKPAI